MRGRIQRRRDLVGVGDVQRQHPDGDPERLQSQHAVDLAAGPQVSHLVPVRTGRQAGPARQQQPAGAAIDQPPGHLEPEGPQAAGDQVRATRTALHGRATVRGALHRAQPGDGHVDEPTPQLRVLACDDARDPPQRGMCQRRLLHRGPHSLGQAPELRLRVGVVAQCRLGLGQPLRGADQRPGATLGRLFGRLAGLKAGGCQQHRIGLRPGHRAQAFGRAELVAFHAGLLELLGQRADHGVVTDQGHSRHRAGRALAVLAERTPHDLVNQVPRRGDRGAGLILQRRAADLADDPAVLVGDQHVDGVFRRPGRALGVDGDPGRWLPLEGNRIHVARHPEPVRVLRGHQHRADRQGAVDDVCPAARMPGRCGLQRQDRQLLVVAAAQLIQAPREGIAADPLGAEHAVDPVPVPHLRAARADRGLVDAALIQFPGRFDSGGGVGDPLVLLVLGRGLVVGDPARQPHGVLRQDDLHHPRRLDGQRGPQHDVG